jgi:sec-independent protein translocase protein TatB
VEILGIGPMELILLLIVMLMVFGPDRLPQIGAKLGRTMRDMRKATRAISTEINATRDAITAEAKPITDPIKDVTDAAKSAGSLVSVAKNPGQAIRDSVLKELNPPPAEAPSEPENTIAPPRPADAAPPPESPVADLPPALPEPENALALPEPEAPLALPEPGAPAADDAPSQPTSKTGAEPAAGEQ